MTKTVSETLDQLGKLFPDAQCELHYGSVFQLVCAVLLSAQTTDVSVNKVTPALFEKYPDAKALSEAQPSDVEQMIRSIGLYRNKAANLILMAKKVMNDFDGEIPEDFEKLQTLPGVGRKTANVVMAEGFRVPALAVDTHVERVSKRLGLVKPEADVLETEKTLRKKIDKELWIRTHHRLIFFGRYLCKARGPLCEQCPFKAQCRYLKGKTY